MTKSERVKGLQVVLNTVQHNINRLSVVTYEQNAKEYMSNLFKVWREIQYMTTDKVKLKGQVKFLNYHLMWFSMHGNVSYLVNALNWMLVGLKYELQIPQDIELVHWYLSTID